MLFARLWGFDVALVQGGIPTPPLRRNCWMAPHCGSYPPSPTMYRLATSGGFVPRSRPHARDFSASWSKCILAGEDDQRCIHYFSTRHPLGNRYRTRTVKSLRWTTTARSSRPVGALGLNATHLPARNLPRRMATPHGSRTAYCPTLRPNHSLRSCISTEVRPTWASTLDSCSLASVGERPLSCGSGAHGSGGKRPALKTSV